MATWGALLRAPRAVLAGDHLQLPPTIISDAAAKQVAAPRLSKNCTMLLQAGIGSRGRFGRRTERRT